MGNLNNAILNKKILRKAKLINKKSKEYPKNFFQSHFLSLLTWQKLVEKIENTSNIKSIYPKKNFSTASNFGFMHLKNFNEWWFI